MEKGSDVIGGKKREYGNDAADNEHAFQQANDEAENSVCAANQRNFIDERGKNFS